MAKDSFSNVKVATAAATTAALGAKRMAISEDSRENSSLHMVSYTDCSEQDI